MSTQPVNLSVPYNTLQVVHTERYNTGGFSTLSLSKYCLTLTTISDYSQADDYILDKPVRRSGWYQADINFNENDTYYVCFEGKVYGNILFYRISHMLN